MAAALVAGGASAAEEPINAHLGSLAYGQVQVGTLVDSTCIVSSIEAAMGICEVPNNFGNFGLGLYVQLNFASVGQGMDQEMAKLRACVADPERPLCYLSFNGRFVGLRGFHQVDVSSFNNFEVAD